MTVVAEQPVATGAPDTIGAVGNPGPAGSRRRPAAAPVHCGEAMRLTAPFAPVPGTVLQVDLLAPVHPEWTCGCGFRMDSSGRVVRDAGRILAAASEVERLQWELDQAQEDLRAALLAGAADGMDDDALAFAAGLTPGEIRDALALRPLA